MIAFIKKLYRDRRGNALVIAGAALPLLVGSAGLASDTIQWTLWKRQLQRAADSAAYAGVYARFGSETVSTAVATDVARNNHTLAGLVPGFPTFSQPANTTNSINAVQVNLQARKTLGFSSLFMSAAPIIHATATAAAVPDGAFCAMGLDPSTTPAVSIGGSATANLGCGIISNSTSPTSAVEVNGNSYSLIADPVAAVGGMPSSINGATDLQPGHLPQPDPFAGLYPTDVPAGMNCQNFNQQVVTTTTGTGQNRVTTYALQPGCFNSFNPGNQTYNLQPGVYYLNNTDFVMNGNATLIGTDVTFILTGTNPGSLQINGTSTLQLTAPTSGTYSKMLFIQSANASSANNNTVNGTNSSYYDGAIYFPKGNVNFTGTSGTMTKCVMVVGFRLSFNGNTNLQNDTAGCQANQKKPGWKIRLVS